MFLHLTAPFYPEAVNRKERKLTVLLTQPNPVTRRIKHISQILPHIRTRHLIKRFRTTLLPSLHHMSEPSIDPRHKHHIAYSIRQHRLWQRSQLKHLITPSLLRRKRVFTPITNSLHSLLSLVWYTPKANAGAITHIKVGVIQGRLKELLMATTFIVKNMQILQTLPQSNNPPLHTHRGFHALQIMHAL